MAFLDLTVKVYVDNEVRFVYFNETLISGVVSGNSGNVELTFSIDSSLVVEGTNILALRLRDDGAGRSLFRGRLETDVRVLYDYGGSFNTSPEADPAIYRHTEEANGSSTTFTETDFDDSAWATHSDPIGSGTIPSSWTLGTDLLVRLEIDSSLLSDPEPGVWIDWAQDGFADGSTAASDSPLARMLPEGGGESVTDNITEDVISIEWWRGGSYDHTSGQQPGGATIRVQNSGGKYNPDNTSSPLYGFLVPGLPVWIGADSTTGSLTEGSSIVGVFAGYVREVVPLVQDGATAYAEIICDDPFGRYQDAQVTLEPSQSRSYADLREGVLDEIGESRHSLAVESGMLPFSAIDDRDALGVLEEINQVTASRHFVDPAGDKDTWYRYTTVNRLHKLTAAADASLNGDDIEALSGYRVTRDTVLNYQRASVSPVSFSLATETVWTYGQLPLAVSSTTNAVIWAEFDEYVLNESLIVNASGNYVTEVTNFGKTAKVVLTALDPSITFTDLRIIGQQLRRSDSEAVVAEDAASAARYGRRSGGDITSDLIGQSGAAQSLVDYMVWRSAQPLHRPSITVSSKSTTTLAFLFGRDLFDVVNITIARLHVSDRRFEIIGLRGSCRPRSSAAPFWQVSYELQQTPNAAPISTWFTVDTDTVDSAQLIAPF